MLLLNQGPCPLLPANPCDGPLKCSAFCQGGVTYYLPSDVVCKGTAPPVYGETAYHIIVALQLVNAGFQLRLILLTPCICWLHNAALLALLWAGLAIKLC
jgi:hypothetical protein